ncbi:MAG: ABC transporter ATP-binding protein [Hyphomicrobiaceae bacterium]|nr:ABC transporter ATP-binding protein [Hyphomicrobiaceae bacterium]
MSKPRVRRFPEKPDGLNPFAAVARLFEGWIDPLKAPKTLQPPATIWRYIWHYVRQAKLPLFASFVLNAISGSLEALLLFYVGRVVDILAGSKAVDGWSGLFTLNGSELTAIFVFAILIRSLLAVLQALIDNQVIGRGFYNLVAWQAYSQVARQSLGFFANEQSGAVLTKTGQAGDSVGNFITGSLSSFWTIATYFGTSMFLFAQLHIALDGIVLAWVVVVLLTGRYFLPRMRETSTDVAEASAEMNGRFVDVFSNIQTVRLYGSAQEADGYMREGVVSYIGRVRRAGRLSVGMHTVMTTASGLAFAATIALCIDLWTRGAISVGSVAAALALILRLNMWMGWMLGSISGLMRNFGVLQNTMEMVSRPIDVVDHPGAGDLVVSKGGIDFKNVSFEYLKGKPVFEDFNLSIAPGERVGLVGRSGAGKSTLVSLLLRFYDLKSGAITIDGQNIAEVKQDSLRHAVGVVTQDTALLHRSVRDNIGIGKPGAALAEIENAARRAEAHDFISALADHQGRKGYDAYVGERGIKLSGGQRQRIAIARVLLKNAPILVLDEATSALDSEVEAAIQSQLDELIEGKTVIAIAHRLSTIAAMDRLVVLDEGRVAEEGTHAELLARGGIYATLWNRQSGGFLGDETERVAERA